MKTNFKTMAVIALSAIITMASCTKDNNAIGKDGGNDATPINVSIALTEKNAVFRSVAAPANVATVNFKDGYVIFVNNVGVVNKVTQIVSGSFADETAGDKDAAKAVGTKAWLDDMKISGGSEIKNVPASAIKVYIVGNLPSGVTAPALAENISDIKDRVIDFASQSNSEGNVADVTLYGDGVTLTAHSSISGAKYAQVEVNAIASRIEIGSISYSSATSFVSRFQIDGIFVNHYYSQMSLSGVVSKDIENNLVDDNAEANTVYSNSSAYTVAALYDYYMNGIGFKVSETSWSAADPFDSNDKNVWAYNVLAPKSCDGIVVGALTAPHVVIRLSNFTTTGDNPSKVYPGTQYLTVKKFREKGTNNVIESFKPGVVYFITDLTFNESNLTDIPEQEAVTVYVEAKLMSWSRQEVDWEF